MEKLIKRGHVRIPGDCTVSSDSVEFPSWEARKKKWLNGNGLN